MAKRRFQPADCILPMIKRFKQRRDVEDVSTRFKSRVPDYNVLTFLKDAFNTQSYKTCHVLDWDPAVLVFEIKNQPVLDVWYHLWKRGNPGASYHTFRYAVTDMLEEKIFVEMNHRKTRYKWPGFNNMDYEPEQLECPPEVKKKIPPKKDETTPEQRFQQKFENMYKKVDDILKAIETLQKDVDEMKEMLKPPPPQTNGRGENEDCYQSSDNNSSSE